MQIPPAVRPLACLAALALAQTSCGCPDESCAEGRSDAGSEPAPEAAVPDATPEAFASLQGGWFNLRFSEVAVEDGGGRPPLSTGLGARLDIERDGGAYAAALGAEWAVPVPMEIEVRSDRVELKGLAPIGPIPCSEYTESWQRISIPRKADGSLGATFAAEGIGPLVETGSMSALHGYERPMRGTGVVTVDDRAASMRGAFRPLTASGQAFPWSVMRLAFDEGVDEASFDVRAVLRRLTPGGEVEVPAIWSEKERGEGSWLSAVVGSVGSWNDVSEGELEARVSAGVLDPSGNAASEFSQAAALLAVGAPREELDFGDGTVPLGLWGETKLLTGSKLCESSSCLQLGPLPSDHAPMAAGVAGRIVGAGGHRLWLRYRVLLDNCTSFTTTTDAVRVVVAAPGGAVFGGGKGYVKTCTDLGADAGALRYASDWWDLEVEVPPSAALPEVGFSISPHAGDYELAHEAMACDYDSVGPTYQQLAVLVQRVRVLP